MSNDLRGARSNRNSRPVLLANACGARTRPPSILLRKAPFSDKYYLREASPVRGGRRGRIHPESVRVGRSVGGGWRGCISVRVSL